MSWISIVSIVALLAIWVGYPLVVACLAAFRRQPGRSTPPETGVESVSIILASCESAPSIRARVADVLRTSYSRDRLEVVVALDASRSRATLEDLADIDSRVRVVVGDAPGGKAAALNAAVRAARHDILVFADSAQRFNRSAITELVAALGDSRLGCVSGMLDCRGRGRRLSLAERYWRYERWLRSREARLYSGVGVTGAIYAMRRSLWAPLPAGLILDDVFVPMRLVLNGWRVGFTDRARAVDTRGFGVGDEYRRKVRTLTGVFQLCAWLPQVLNPRRNPIWLQFTFHKLLRLLTPYFLMLFAAGATLRLLRAAASGVTWMALACLVAALLVTLVPALRRRVAGPVVAAWTLQRSIVVATVNGLRGRWDVWQN